MINYKRICYAVLSSFLFLLIIGCQDSEVNSAPTDNISVESNIEFEEEPKGIQYIKNTNVPTVDSIVKEAVFMENESSHKTYYYDLDDDYITAGNQFAIYCAILEGVEGWKHTEQTQYDYMIKTIFEKNNAQIAVGFANLEGNYVCVVSILKTN